MGPALVRPTLNFHRLQYVSYSVFRESTDLKMMLMGVFVKANNIGTSACFSTCRDCLGQQKRSCRQSPTSAMILGGGGTTCFDRPLNAWIQIFPYISYATSPPCCGRLHSNSGLAVHFVRRAQHDQFSFHFFWIPF